MGLRDFWVDPGDPFRRSIERRIGHPGRSFGVPYDFVTYHLAYEVSLFDARDRQHPIFQRVYCFRDSRAAGLYYNGVGPIPCS
jgi:hypothetical protein